eukprot:2756695-Alexandrium_andersonii.AAC.1
MYSKQLGACKKLLQTLWGLQESAPNCSNTAPSCLRRRCTCVPAHAGARPTVGEVGAFLVKSVSWDAVSIFS